MTLNTQSVATLGDGICTLMHVYWSSFVWLASTILDKADASHTGVSIGFCSCVSKQDEQMLYRGTLVIVFAGRKSFVS